MKLSRSLLCPFIAMGFVLGVAAIGQTLEEKTKTKENLKQVATGMMMYTQDTDDLFPYPRENKTALAVMAPYVRRLEAFRSLNPGSIFVFNPAIGGVATTAIKNPGDVVMFYDSKPWPDGSHLVAFCDGHTVSVTGKDWKHAQLSLHANFKRTAKRLPKNFYKLTWGNKNVGG